MAESARLGPPRWSPQAAGRVHTPEAKGRIGQARHVTTFTVLADVANVAGDRLTVESITKSGAEIHG